MAKRRKIQNKEEAPVASSFINKEVPKGETTKSVHHSNGTYNVISVNEVAVYISEKQNIESATSVLSPAIDTHLGGKKVTMGIWSSKDIHDVTVTTEVSFTKDSWSAPVYQATSISLKKGLTIVVIDLEDIKTPFYRFGVNFKNPQTCVMEFQFCNAT